MFVSITRLRIRSWRYLPPFIFHSLLSARQARAADGSISLTLLRDSGNVFWTRTVWRDEPAMRVFMLTGSHARTMPRLLQWCDEASIVNWTQAASEPPNWLDAYARMCDEGRRSKLRYPNGHHLAGVIRRPAA